MQRIRLSWIIVMGMAIAGQAHAQDVPTETGAVIEPTEEISEEDRQELRAARTEGFRAAVLQSRKELDAIAKKQALLRTKRAEHRSECRIAVRKANRDTKLRTNVSCYREDLNLTWQLLEHDQRIIAILPGVTADVRSFTADRAALAADAVETIIDAIDAEVYGSVEELMEAKTNLGEKYQMPLWEELRVMRGDALLSWIAHLLLRIDQAKAETDEGAESTRKLLESRTCLEEAEALLWGVLDKNNKEAHKTDLSQAQSKLKSCTSSMKSAERMWDQEQETTDDQI